MPEEPLPPRDAPATLGGVGTTLTKVPFLTGKSPRSGPEETVVFGSGVEALQAIGPA